MNTALLLLGAAVVVPLAAFEARRKWRDLTRQPRALLLRPHDDLDRDWIAARIAEHSFTPGPVWIGVDLACGDDRCVVHDGHGYAVDKSRAPGNFEDFPPSEGTSAGAGE